ncbi:MAG: response regulator transcription factor [Lachnospiraceae bacterium]|nr:response regulator transcription factor [Lachnospiraceae bacterium]
MSTKVIIADDHILIREGMRQLLEFDGTIEVVGEAGDGFECLKICKEIPADILLLDINMPNMNGIETLKEIRKQKLNLKVLILTVHNEIEYLVQATDIGVEGYILKDSGSAELKKAINSIMDDSIYIQPSLIPAFNNYLIRKDTDMDKIKLLTKRELEVLIEVAKGNFNKDIALHLNISERTVKNHMFNIFKKLDVSDRTQAAVFAIKNNLIQLR